MSRCGTYGCCDVDLLLFYLRGDRNSARTGIGILRGKEGIKKEEGRVGELKRSCDRDALDGKKKPATYRVQAVSSGTTGRLFRLALLPFLESRSRLLHMSDTCSTDIGQHS